MVPTPWLTRWAMGRGLDQGMQSSTPKVREAPPAVMGWWVGGWMIDLILFLPAMQPKQMGSPDPGTYRALGNAALQRLINSGTNFYFLVKSLKQPVGRCPP